MAITEEIDIQMLEKLADGNFKKKNPETKASQVKFEDGSTVETHKADLASHHKVITGSFTIDSSEETTVDVGRKIVYLKIMTRNAFVNSDADILEWVSGIDLNHFYSHSNCDTPHMFFSDTLTISDNQEKFTLRGAIGFICNYLAIVK